MYWSLRYISIVNLCDICKIVYIFNVLCAFLANLVIHFNALVHFYLIQIVIMFDRLLIGVQGWLSDDAEQELWDVLGSNPALHP